MTEYEKKIYQDPIWAYHYAKDVIDNRWPEAEKCIIKDPDYWSFYLKNNDDQKQDIYQNVIEQDPENIKYCEDADRENQELAIKLGGKRIIPLIKNLDPEIKKKYPEITNLKRSGLFK